MELPESSLEPDHPQSRTAGLYNYLEVARFVGADPYAILRDAGIPPAAVADPETWVPSHAIVKVLEDTAAISQCESVGMLMAQSRSFSLLGPVSLLLERQPTVRAIVESLITHRRLMNDVIMWGLEEESGCAIMRLNCQPGIGTRQTVELATGVFYRAVNEIMAGRWEAECIHFRHSPPRDRSIYHRFFRCQVQFDADFDGISCSSESLDAENPTGDPALAAHALRYVEMLSARRPDASISDRVRHAIHLLLHSGDATIDRVGRTLAVTPRTLQRLLSAEGTSFAQLLDETRQELALRYLGGSGHSLAEIAGLLGYSSQGSFTRWFTSAFGKSPRAWRRGTPFKARRPSPGSFLPRDDGVLS